MPQGWDTQGLPTELAVQNNLKISPNNTNKFRASCKRWTTRMIKQMKQRMTRLGYMPDWSLEYRTMDESYHQKVQLALLNLYHMGRIYRAEHPVHWCPSCKTTLAQAELGYKQEKGLLAYLKFKTDDDYVEITTTRPELLHSCVAVAINPKDERHKHLKGRYLEIPIYRRLVPVIADEAVSKEFGTGIVMICTFGDEQDVKWVLKHKLPTIEALDENGKLKNSQRYDGLTTKEARQKILSDLKDNGTLSRIEKISHNVLIHKERSACQTPIEFLPKPQWLIHITDLKEKIIELAKQITWFPSHMQQRLIDWTRGLEWDWIFSRQRTFGTPIPFWHCQNCGNIIAPKEKDLPVNPAIEKPPSNKCSKCNSQAIIGAKEVCDCWIDSSITPLLIAGWPNTLKPYPADLRQQGSEIIRTWAFYTLIQCYLQTGQIPFKRILVNGMLLGPDGRAMSSSLGNTIDPLEAVEKYGADALRQTLLSVSIGSDLPFQRKDLKHARAFLQKFWSFARFAQQHLKCLELPKKTPKLYLVDQWILTCLQQLIAEVTSHMEKFQYNLALQKIQSFVWHQLCDHYLELAKYRLYTPPRKWMKKSALYTINHVLWTTIRLYAPFAPHITEEIFQKLYNTHNLTTIHTARWPTINRKHINKEEWKTGELLKEVISTVRKLKSQRKLPLNAEVPHITIYCKENEVRKRLQKIRLDIKETGRIKRVVILKAKASQNISSNKIMIRWHKN
jgi:valyl-tRNA synthetase